MRYYDIYSTRQQEHDGRIGNLTVKGKATPKSLQENLGGIPKAIHRETWMRMYPFGIPRTGMDIEDIDRLADTPIVAAVINRIIDLFASTDEKIESTSGDDTATEEAITNLFENPNSGPHSWEDEKRMWCRDVLKYNTGVLQKMYRRNGEFAEIRSIDSSSILINFDYYAMLSDRAYDYIPIETVINAISSGKNTYMAFMKNAPAYFQWQYGIPIPFGRRELMISWRYPNNRSVYGKSSIEILGDIIYILIYGTQHHLDFYLRNELPYHGLLCLEGMQRNELQRFQADLQEKKKHSVDKWGDRTQNFFSIPAVGFKGEFITPRISHKEMEILESFEHFEDIVWMIFGLNKVAMGKAESTTYSNALTVKRNIYEHCVEPLHKKFARALNRGLCLEEFDSDVRISYPMSDVQGRIMEYQLYRLRLQTELASVNELREELNKELWPDEKYNMPTKISGGDGFPFQQQQFTERAEEIKSRVYRGEVVSKAELLELASEYDY